MESALSLTFKPSFHHQKSNLPYPLLKPSKQSTIKTNASTKPQTNPIIQTLKLTTRAIVFAAVISKFQQYPAKAEPITQTVTTESESESLESKKLEAREALEQILTQNPLSFEALFENALLMESFGEGEAVVKRLQQALEIEENKEKEARDVRLIIAQVQFLKKNVDEALKRYDELVTDDPNDFRPYFCKGMVYSMIDKDDEAKVQFAKYRELSSKKLFEVEGYQN
ncbi:hypothetical protein L1987_77171 [Smallanthus sonchifolius]|uniref:Uncharacterized protein n=1 Tax=Smallanthus sonchifolius TaxID=185202 RepID=A0ACB8ZA99_9ASTR|nr:hypothetical protein L1987_77171 [Smallanthus sonchifolius]